MVPVLSIISGVILDTFGLPTQVPVPRVRVGVVIVLISSALMGTSNATLFSMGPSILAVFYGVGASLHRRWDRIWSVEAHDTPLARSSRYRFKTTDDDNGMAMKDTSLCQTLFPPSQCIMCGYDADELAGAYAVAVEFVSYLEA